MTSKWWSDLIPLNSIFWYPIGLCPTTMSHPPLCLRLYHPIQCLPLLNFTATSHPFLFLQMSGCMLRLAMWPTERLWTYVDKIMNVQLVQIADVLNLLNMTVSELKHQTIFTVAQLMLWSFKELLLPLHHLTLIQPFPLQLYLPGIIRYNSYCHTFYLSQPTWYSVAIMSTPVSSN